MKLNFMGKAFTWMNYLPVGKCGDLEEDEWIPKEITLLVLRGIQHMPPLTKLNIIREGQLR